MRRTPQEVRRLQGQRVALRDLASRTELNGKVGRLAGADGERWKVELDGSGEVVKARERNLELTGLAETASLAAALDDKPYESYTLPPLHLPRYHHYVRAEANGRREPTLEDVHLLEYEKFDDGSKLWPVLEKEREWYLEARLHDFLLADGYEPPKGAELDRKAPLAAKAARRKRRERLEKFLWREQLREQMLEMEAQEKADLQRARKAMNKADQTARDKEAHAHFLRITVHLGSGTHAPNVGGDIQEELRAIQRRDERVRPPPLSPPPLAPAPTLHAARAQEGRPAFSFNENFNIARDGRKGAVKLEQLYIKRCMPAISLWPSVAWPTYSHASRYIHWWTCKELRTCRLCFALTAQKMDAEVHAVLLASLHARLRLEETIPEDKCADFIDGLVEKGEYGTAADEVNFESSEQRRFIEEKLKSDLRESRAERGWLCGCKMRFPIWREGGAYGGCRDCFDAQLVEMVDTRALGADDARKKAWVDARTYEWDVHYFYPMADEAARQLMRSGTFTESHKQELRQRLRAARAADAAAGSEAEAVAEAAERAAREKALAEAAGWAAAAAAESAGIDDASLPSAAASVAATPGAFASRVCADPDCADCAAEFECVACMEEDGEGPCEDEGGVLV